MITIAIAIAVTTHPTTMPAIQPVEHLTVEGAGNTFTVVKLMCFGKLNLYALFLDLLLLLLLVLLSLMSTQLLILHLQ